MQQQDTIPFEPEAQRSLSRQWGALIGGRARAADLLRANGVRTLVRDSWHRAARAQVNPDLVAAPLVLDDDALYRVHEQTDWLSAAHDAISRHQRTFAGDGHILALFDDDGRMLHAEGDAGALEGLGALNFRPGGHWAETAVGTNGPGTALATGVPTHIIGHEHFCETLHGWHCAAVPIRDPATARIVGVIDISGFRDHAHPHTLNLALALGVAIEQTLAARDVERRFAILQRFTELSARYPGDGVLAMDRSGHVLGASPNLAPELATALATLVKKAPEGLAREDGVPVMIGDRRVAQWFPVLHGRHVLGGCFVLQCHTLPRGTEGIPFKPGDVRVYARRFFEAGAKELGRLSVQIDPAVYDAMQAYHWPGNVRELRHVIRRVLQASSGVVRVQDLPHVVREAFAGGSDAHSSAIDAEDARMMEVVRDSRTMAEAATKLGITRSTLYRRMERFGLKPKRVLGRE